MAGTIEQQDVIRQLDAVEAFVEKDYLLSLNRYPILPPSDSINPETSQLQLFKLSKIIYKKDDNIPHKLTSVISALQVFDGTIALILSGHEDGIDLYLGTCSPLGSENRLMSKVLKGCFEGQFPGTLLSEISIEQNTPLLNRLCYSDHLENEICISSINLVPSEKEGQKRAGLEEFIESMKGHLYTCFLLASPVKPMEIEKRLRGYEELHSVISPFVKTSIANGYNEGITLTTGTTETVSASITDSLSKTSGKSSTHTEGTNSGFSMGGSLLLAFNIMQGSMKSDSEGLSSGTTDTKGKTSTNSQSVSESRGVTNGTSHNVTIEQTNKRAQVLLEKIEMQCKRLQEGNSYGLWECSAFFISPRIQTAVSAASTFRSLMIGEKSYAEKTFINIFTRANKDKTILLRDCLKKCVLPMFDIRANGEGYEQPMSASNYLSSKELSLLFAMPTRSVPGLIVSSMAEFGRSVYREMGNKGTSIKIGHAYHMNTVQPNTIDLDLESISSHCFITGTTGSGKSNTVYCLLEKLLSHNIPFLVIEPAKGEYRKQFCHMPGIRVFGTNQYNGEFLTINPFYFPSQVHILEHLDRLIEIFNTCWEMYAAMPAILKDAIQEIYVKKGWDLYNSEYIGEGPISYPTFSDLLYELPRVISNSQYSGETKSDYTGALVTRVRSLTTGIYGQVFSGDFDIDDKTLFDENVIVDLSRVGSTEAKSLIMGILILKLTEYRESTSEGMNAKLCHVTVLEEAHNILKNPMKLNNSPSTNIISKSVEMISASIAEMRTYGEGFIIVDQSPSAVDESAVKNTNTKIIMRLPDYSDCENVGHAISLSREQIQEISRLNRGIAIIKQNDWLESVMVQIDKASNQYLGIPETTSYNELMGYRSNVLTIFIDEYLIRKTKRFEAIDAIISSGHVPECKKYEMRSIMLKIINRLENKWSNVLLGHAIVSILGSRDMLQISEKHYSHEIKEKVLNNETEALSLMANNWYQELSHSMSRCYSMDKEHNDIALQYIIFAKQYEIEQISYKELYRRIF